MSLVASPAPRSSINVRQTETPARPRLSAVETAAFAREGYLLFDRPVLAPEKFAGLRAYFEQMLAALPPGQRPEDMDVPHMAHPRLFDWVFDDAILDLVEPLLGPDIALFSTHFLCKPAGDGKRVPWHQDSFYWRHLLEPMQVVTVWLAIDESDDRNGAMRVIPRTHLSGDASYDDADPRINTFPREISRKYLAEAQAVTMNLQPNQASLHAAGLFHGSEPNRDTRRRCGYTMRFISTRTQFNSERGFYHQIYLARGRDHAGNVYCDPAAPRADLIEARNGRIRRGH